MYLCKERLTSPLKTVFRIKNDKYTLHSFNLIKQILLIAKPRFWICICLFLMILFMFPFILFRRNINYLLPRLLNFWTPDILPRIINCYDAQAYMPQHQYLASYVYIITVYTSLYYILKDKISNLTTYTCMSTDLSAFSLFIRQIS